MKKPLISIVANFYNSRKFIPKLLYSIFNQTFRDWELICIDDCSPTNEFEIITAITSKEGHEQQVKIIRNKTNVGISKAKQIGIENAQGLYITFIDGDDWLETKALEVMVTPALKYDIDYVIMNHYRRYPLGIKQPINNITDEYFKPLFQPEINDKYFISFFGINKINVAYWGKLIKTDIVRQSEFKHIDYPIGEDLLFNLYIFPLLKSMMFVDYYGYNWRFGGITSSKHNITKTKEIIEHFAEIYRIKRDFAIKHNYTKTILPMLIELKNILLNNISALCTTKRVKSDVKSLIDNIILSEKYSDITQLLSNPLYAEDPIVKGVCTKDAMLIYSTCHKYYKRQWKRRFLKSIIRFFNY